MLIMAWPKEFTDERLFDCYIRGVQGRREMLRGYRLTAVSWSTKLT